MAISDVTVPLPSVIADLIIVCVISDTKWYLHYSGWDHGEGVHHVPLNVCLWFILASETTKPSCTVCSSQFSSVLVNTEGSYLQL